MCCPRVGGGVYSGHPVFVDIDPITFNIDCDLIDGAIGPRTRFLVAVHLYGNCVNMPALMATADRHGLTVIEDCAQAHGAAVGEKMAGTWGRAGAYSFYPTKNLGACGDGGMVVTADEGLSERLRMLRNYGKNERDRLQEQPPR